MPRERVLFVHVPNVDAVSHRHNKTIALWLRSCIDLLREDAGVLLRLGGRQRDRFTIVHKDLKLQLIPSDALIAVVVGDLDNHSFAWVNSLESLPHVVDGTISFSDEIIRNRRNGSVEVSSLQLASDQATTAGVDLSNFVRVSRSNDITARDFKLVIV